MPSDDAGSAVDRALQALAAPLEAFDSALALTAEEVRGFLDSHREPGEGGPDRVAAELGPFASTHIDPDRFANLVDLQQPVNVELLHDAERGWSGLLALRDRGDELHVVRVPAGGDLVQAVSDALGEAGRAFGLTRAVRFVRNGGAQTDAHLADPLPPRHWSDSERSLAPPLVVEVAGADLRVSGLGDLLEGAQKLVLVVNGPAPPAPLARLIRPGLLVLQTSDAARLDECVDFEGPVVAAVLPKGAAEFIHDPRMGTGYGTRLTIEFLPDTESVVSVGVLSASHVLEDVAHLRGLASFAGAGAAAVEATAVEAPGPLPQSGLEEAPDPADRLAGWLLEQAGF